MLQLRSFWDSQGQARRGKKSLEGHICCDSLNYHLTKYFSIIIGICCNQICSIGASDIFYGTSKYGTFWLTRKYKTVMLQDNKTTDCTFHYDGAGGTAWDCAAVAWTAARQSSTCLSTTGGQKKNRLARGASAPGWLIVWSDIWLSVPRRD